MPAPGTGPYPRCRSPTCTNLVPRVAGRCWWQWTTRRGEVTPVHSSDGPGTRRKRNVGRKTALPADQLGRLKDLYNQQRDALAALAAAEEAVTAADHTLTSAQLGLKEAQAGAETAYQALVDLMGADAAAELTGRRSNRKRATTARSRARQESDEQEHQPAIPELDRADGQS
jgi:hypothetical protein